MIRPDPLSRKALARPTLAGLGVLVLCMLITSSARACPGCDTSVVVWFTVLDDQPATWLLVAATPFVLMALLGAALHRIGHPSRGRSSAAPVATASPELRG